jgi:hypothetical protein
VTGDVQDLAAVLLLADPGGLDVWAAARRSGQQLRYVVGRTPGELAGKLVAIEAEERCRAYDERHGR